ncbi:MAG: hypothetical protein ACTHQE_07885 [Thermomicrobiales bacterium]
MAISTGTLPISPRSPAVAPAPRGRDLPVRPRPRPLGVTPAQEQELRALERWEAMRGQVLVSVPVMAVGAFPGSLRQGQMLDRTDLTVTEFFFALGEGTDHGFAIPADDIVDLTIVPDPAGHMRALRIRYVADHESGCIQAFTVSTAGFRRVARFKTILRLAAAADIAVAAWDPAEIRPRSLAITWAHVRRFSNELMVWSGTACGPVGGWLASARAECRVWMTTHSFFWCDVAGEGVNRLPVADILDVTMDLGAETPVLAIALRDAEGCRQEILFGFDRREFGDRAEATCRSLVESLKEYGVAERTEPVPFAPWLPGQAVDWPTGEPAPMRRTRPMKAQPSPTPELQEAIPDEVMAWLAQVDGTMPIAAGTTATTIGIAEGALKVVPDTTGTPVLAEAVEAAPTAPATPWERMAAFERACLAEIRALEAQDVAPVPLHVPGLQDALAALSTLIESGEIELLDADTRARRMRGLAECRAALRTLCHQQEAGIRSRSAILTERRAVLARVETLLSDA